MFAPRFSKTAIGLAVLEKMPLHFAKTFDANSQHKNDSQNNAEQQKGFSHGKAWQEWAEQNPDSLKAKDKGRKTKVYRQKIKNKPRKAMEYKRKYTQKHR